MNRDDLLLQGLKAKLSAWLAYIQKAALATQVEFEPAEDNEFYIVVRWEKPSPGEYKKLFSRQYVFGNSMKFDRNAWEVRRCVGVLAREVVAEVLSFRGV